MTTVHRKGLKIMGSIAIAALMLLSMLTTALAKDYSEGFDADNQAKASITKVFAMPKGTTTPAVTFTFTFTPLGMKVSGVTGTDTTGIPAIGPKTVTFTRGEEPDENTGGLTYIDDKDGTKYVIKETDDFIAHLTPASFATNGAGIYVYLVEETYGGQTIVSADEKEKTYYSSAKYLLEVWVSVDEDGKLYVQYVSPITIKEYLDVYYEGTEGGDKIDPTPGEWRTKPYETLKDGFSQLIFTNKYWKTDGEDPGKTALEIIKEVDGNDGEHGKYFTFNVKVIQPAVIPLDPDNPVFETYRAYVVDTDGTIVKAVNNEYHNGTISGTDAHGDYYIFTSDTTKTVLLKHNQKLIFVDLHVGADVEVTETGDKDYKPAYKHFLSLDTYPGTIGAAWGFPLNPDDDDPHYLPEGTNQNEVTFTNTRTGATPTGISVDDLPYFTLIGLGAAGFVGFLAVKLRKGKDT
ncbi:MAG: hypothetical protein FWH17_08995 [Oscillospiraceae bacterium]|nr:hypothetical protein [Oscillospiraceae bacterium]